MIDYTTMGWEPYTSISAPSGVTIHENHCSINRRLGLFAVHLELVFSSGMPSTVINGTPNPVISSFFLGNRIGGGSLDGKVAAMWARNTGNNFGAGAVSDCTSVRIYGMYPIEPSNS